MQPAVDAFSAAAALPGGSSTLGGNVDQSRAALPSDPLLPETSAPASDEPADGMAKVNRLATELAARMRYAQIVERPLPPEQVTALVRAARLLQEKGEPWPQLVGEVLKQVADDLAEEATPTMPEEPGNSRLVAGLNRFLGAFRRETKPL